MGKLLAVTVAGNKTEHCSGTLRVSRLRSAGSLRAHVLIVLSMACVHACEGGAPSSGEMTPSVLVPGWPDGSTLHLEPPTESSSRKQILCYTKILPRYMQGAKRRSLKQQTLSSNFSRVFNTSKAEHGSREANAHPGTLVHACFPCEWSTPLAATCVQ